MCIYIYYTFIYSITIVKPSYIYNYIYLYYGLDYFVMLQKMKVRIYLLSTPG